METKEAVTRIFDRAPEALLDRTRFGRSENALYWLDRKSFLQISRELKAEAGFDWLENLSAMQVENDLVFTYFLRRFEDASGSSGGGLGGSPGETLILRISAPMNESARAPGADWGDSWVSMQSVSTVWPMARLQEAEISRLFGVNFGNEARAVKEAKPSPENHGWEGFPLRKDFDVLGAKDGLPGGALS